VDLGIRAPPGVEGEGHGQMGTARLASECGEQVRQSHGGRKAGSMAGGQRGGLWLDSGGLLSGPRMSTSLPPPL
jgi:hypothetical protein